MLPLPSPRLPFAKVTGLAMLTLSVLCTLGYMAVYHSDLINQRSAESDHLIEQFGKLTQNDMASDGEGWHMHEFAGEKRDLSNNLGEYSQIWHGRIGDFKATASIDYPFEAWHDLIVCYRNQGWQIGATE